MYNFKRESLYEEFNHYRKSDYKWFLEFRLNDSYYYNSRLLILGKRYSFYSLLKSRVFDRNMVNGLCYGKFYGRDKILYKRKYPDLKIT